MKIKSKILLFAMGPLLAFGLLLVFMSNSKINNVVSGTIENGLRNAALSVRNTLTYADEGEYGLDKKGNMCKGDFNITKTPQIATDLKESTNTDIAIFYGDIRYMTSILGSSGNPIVGTKAEEDIVQEVLVNGNEFFAKDINIYGNKYFGYYIPLFNEAGEPVGMVFAGIEQADAKAQIQSILNLMIIIMLII